MYDNENLSHTGDNQQSTGNFSGTQYFNYMDKPLVQQPEQPHVENPTPEQPRMEESVQQATQSQQEIPQEQTARSEQPVRERVEHREAPKADTKKQEKPKKMGFFSKLLVSISLGLFFGIFAGIGFVGVQQASNTLQPKETPVVEEPEQVEKPEVQGSVEAVSPQVQAAGTTVVYTDSQSNVSNIVKDVMPAMVSIINNYTEVSTFWGQTYREELSSSGSGIIVSENEEELLIVSNQHVVADADQLLVTLIDETQVEAYVKGVDADMDLAVIAIKLDDLSQETKDAIAIANLGNSDELILGEQVIAIGNALGYGQSVTVGYVSALDRQIEIDDGSLRTFIQTDAAINPGNSGGALLNSKGEVIGINSNKIGGTSIEGMGYAIPITAASPIIADLMERQTRDKVSDSELGYMGITYQDVTDQVSMMYGMPKGVYVLSVLEGTGAEAAGIIMGDVIVEFDGNKITCFQDLQSVLQYYAVGDTAKVTVMRPMHGAYAEYDLEITLGERPVETGRN